MTLVDTQLRTKRMVYDKLFLTLYKTTMEWSVTNCQFHSLTSIVYIFSINRYSEDTLETDEQ